MYQRNGTANVSPSTEYLIYSNIKCYDVLYTTYSTSIFSHMQTDIMFINPKII